MTLRRVQIIQTIGSAINARLVTKFGTRQTWKTNLVIAQQKFAARFSWGSMLLRALTQNLASKVSLIAEIDTYLEEKFSSKGFWGPTSMLALQKRSASKAAWGLSHMIASKPKSAGNIVQMIDDMTHQSHVIAAAVESGATKQWTNPANLTGPPNLGLSTFDGDALILAVGDLRGDFVAHSNRPSTLLIESVHMDFYGSVIGLPVVYDGQSRLNLRFHFGVPSLGFTLESIRIGADDFSVVPKSYRLDNGAGKFIDAAASNVTWASITALKASWDAAVILGRVAAHYRADAVRLRVVARDTHLF